MNRDITLSALLAASLHVVALFGLSPGEKAPPSPEGPAYVEVALLAPTMEESTVESEEEGPPEPAAPESPPPEPEQVEQALAAVEMPEARELVEELEFEPEPLADEVVVETPETALVETVLPPAPTRAAVPTLPAPMSPVAAPAAMHSSSTAPTDLKTVVRLSEPNYRKRARMYYPAAARQRKQSGVVVLNLFISPSGKAEKIEIKESSGFSLLDNAAADMARRSEYLPALAGNRAVASMAEASYRFVLEQAR